MLNPRIFALEAHVRFSEEAATVTEIIQTENSSIAIWGVKPGQIVKAHSHHQWTRYLGGASRHFDLLFR